MNPPDIPSRARKLGWIHFGVMTGFLLIVAVGWNVAMNQLKWWFRKEPVPWPAGVVVNQKTFQNQTFPTSFGPYRLKEDGDLKHADDMLSTLKIGTTLDEGRYSERKSNWYVLRVYEDTREPETSPYRYWQVDVVFYTGGEVTVPHVPDICVQAGGAASKDRRVIDLTVPDAPESWRNIAFVGLTYEPSQQMQEFVQYYLFSVNGIPEADRDKVRLLLANPLWRYVFYSKIQFSPGRNVDSTEIADKKAAEFMKYCLPAVLKQLPSAEEIQKLYK